VALKTGQLGVLYWDDAIPLAACLEEGGTQEAAAYLAAWKGLAGEATQRLNVAIADAESAKARLAAANVFVLAHRPVGGGAAARAPRALLHAARPPALGLAGR
jgi:AP-1 complex subunit beta-1